MCWLLPIFIASLIFTAILPHAAAEEEWQYKANQEPWNCREEQFIRDMLTRWRDDYNRLSTGEIRLKVWTVLYGLQKPADCYTIETLKKGSITFKNVDGIICCTIHKP